MTRDTFSMRLSEAERRKIQQAMDDLGLETMADFFVYATSLVIPDFGSERRQKGGQPGNLNQIGGKKARKEDG